MKPKLKATIFNFIGFAVFFLSFRFGLGFLLEMDTFYLALIAAISASILAPKFAAIKTENGDRLFIKWIFNKTPKEL